MIKKILFLLFSFVIFIGYSQFGPQQIISSETDKAYVAIPFDIDSDGFIDILSAQGENYQMVWFRNLDGLGNFGPKTVITNEPALYLSIDFVDIDTDGDKDILFLENNPRQIRWIQNLDSYGDFGSENLIVDIDFITSLKAIDIDNDGDLDLFATISNTFTDEIVWFENEDGMGNFGAPIELIQGNTAFFTPILEDLDNDGDLDILTSLESYYPSKVLWYENTGDLSFDIEHDLLDFGYTRSDWVSISRLQFIDIDTDGLKDIYYTTFLEPNSTNAGWLKNQGENGSFAEPQSLNYYRANPSYDLDGDGDIDMLGWDRFVNELYWIENADGLGTFKPKRIISSEIDFPRDANSADLDGDGLLDIVSASLGDNIVAWYKNTGILGIAENDQFNFQLFPNPTNGIVTC